MAAEIFKDKLVSVKRSIFYSKNKLPEKFTDKKHNVFLGIGFWSNKSGLSEKMPICVLSMLVAADKVRRLLNPEQGYVFIMLADSLAIESSESQRHNYSLARIYQKKDEYRKAIEILAKKLNIERVVIDFSSNFIKDQNYLEIQNEVFLSNEYKELVASNRELDEANKNYIHKETAMSEYYYRHKDCGVKISWTRDIKNISSGIQKKSFDEAWFDDYYTKIFARPERIAFVYIKAGAGLKLSDGKSSIECVPYCYANKEEIRILFGDNEEAIRMKFFYKDESLKKYEFKSNTVKDKLLSIVYALVDDAKLYNLELQTKVENKNLTAETLIADLTKITSILPEYMNMRNTVTSAESLKHHGIFEARENGEENVVNHKKMKLLSRENHII